MVSKLWRREIKHAQDTDDRRLDVLRIWRDSLAVRFKLCVGNEADVYALRTRAISEYQRFGDTRWDHVGATTGELVSNAFIHGNGGDPTKRVTMYCLWRQVAAMSLFYVAVQDQGDGFDLDNPPFVEGRSGTPPEGSNGLVVARECTDVLYNMGATVVGVFQEPRV